MKSFKISKYSDLNNYDKLKDFRYYLFLSSREVTSWSWIFWDFILSFYYTYLGHHPFDLSNLAPWLCHNRVQTSPNRTNIPILERDWFCTVRDHCSLLDIPPMCNACHSSLEKIRYRWWFNWDETLLFYKNLYSQKKHTFYHALACEAAFKA